MSKGTNAGGTGPATAPLTLRPFRLGDEGAIVALLQAARLPTEDVGGDLLDGFLVARRGADLVGVVGVEVHGEDGLLRSLVVAPTERGSGLGTRLVHEIEELARAWGVTRNYLLTTTAEDFFDRRGYEKLAREDVPAAIAATAEFAALCPADAVCMTRALAVPRDARRQG